MRNDPTVTRAVASSALSPGAVVGEVDDGLTNFVSDIHDLERGEVLGYNSRVVGGYRQLFPRLSRPAFLEGKLQDLPEAPGALESVVNSLTNLSEMDRKQFLATRRMVVQTLPSGVSRYVIVPRVPVSMGEIELLADSRTSREPVEVQPISVEDLESRPEKRTFLLASLFKDEDIARKYSLTLRMRHVFNRVAVTDPAAAAAMYQVAMNSTQSAVSVTVKAAAMDRSVPQACNAVKQLCKSAPIESASVHCEVMVDEMFMYGPGGERDWFVRGPIKRAVELSYVYWLVRQQGLVSPSVALALELALLDITVGKGESAAAPVLEYHSSLSGTPPASVGVAPETASMLSALDRVQLESFRERLVPVLGSDRAQLATAVRVTDGYVLVNSHVFDVDSGSTVDGKPLVASKSLARDLWAMKLSGQAEPWCTGTPELGDLAVVCYLSSGRMSCSAPVKVTSVDSQTVVTTKDDSVSFGTSGGALVLLKDMSLVGVHSASTQSSLLSFRFGDEQLSAMLDSESLSAVSRHSDVGSFAESIVGRMKSKGLHSMLQSAVGAIVPVYVDAKHVGMAVNNGEYFYTTCDPSLPLRLQPTQDAEAVPVKYQTVDGSGYYKTPTMPGPSVPLYRREASFFERVFVVGRDDDSYMTMETQVVHVGPDSRTFVLADIPGINKPVQGGLVLAVRDCAVLGVCGARSASTSVGLGYKCWALRRDAPVRTNDPRTVLATAFPFLNLAAWPDDLVEEVFTHASASKYRDSGRLFNAGMKPLANVGDNIAKACLYASLRTSGVPHAQWATVMQSLQSNAIFAKKAWEFGFANSVIVGPGVSLQKDSKAYADLTEALIGAAHLVERPEVVAQLCSDLSIVYKVV